jgi:hypothetical protein
MSRSVLPTAAALAAAWIVGCGPLERPMPPRLKADKQKEIDDAWDAALTPVGKHDRQQWLDGLITTQAYQAGVDSLRFRSEKAFGGGKVVMEVFFDRAKPGEDRFVVTVFDKAGAQLRQEKYSRADVDQAAKDLFDETHGSPPQPDDPPEVVKRRAGRESRLKAVAKMLPETREEEK